VDWRRCLEQAQETPVEFVEVGLTVLVLIWEAWIAGAGARGKEENQSMAINKKKSLLKRSCRNKLAS
jgi:hypothetical protein